MQKTRPGASCEVVRRYNPEQKTVWRSGRSNTDYNIHRRNWRDCVVRTPVSK
ncbi:hypothetical protein DPMN_075544 [Dreissena polymorpha]|uniref:Uncharacterized protein n=1 Tax=Dreissena polymorpha TaxID=45954 RepID=A0A9D3YKK1_DREPO|nr:hypothetical protein DPMN_075544 [Dreissena polymorpha]